MITKFNNGYGYENNTPLAFQTSDWFELSFHESSLYVGGVMVKGIVKNQIADDNVDLIDGFGNVLQTTDTINYIRFRLASFVTRSVSFYSDIDEIIPTRDVSVSNVIAYALQDATNYSEPMEIVFKAQSGYTMLNVILQMTMGGVDVSSYYDNEIKTYQYHGVDVVGTRLYIPSLTGDLIVRGSANAIQTLSVTKISDNATITAPNTLQTGDSLTITIASDSGYSFDEHPSVTINGVDAWDLLNVKIRTFSGVTKTNYILVFNPNVVDGDVVITANAKTNPTFTMNLIGVAPTSAQAQIQYGRAINKAFNISSDYYGYNPTIVVTNDGVDITSEFTWDRQSATRFNLLSKPQLTSDLNDYPYLVHGDVVITITAKELQTLSIESETQKFHRIQSILAHYNEEYEDLMITIKGEIDVDVTEQTFSVPITLQEGEHISGLSLTSGGKLYIPIDVETNVDWDESLTLYPYIREYPIFTDTDIYLYQFSGENNVVDKSSYLHEILHLTGTLRSGTTMVNPIIAFQFATDYVPNFNYVWIPKFNRYYFVTDIQSINNGLWNVSMRCDVLMSYRFDILNQIGLVARNEYEFNEDLIDSERLVENEKEIISEELEITDDCLDLSELESGIENSLVVIYWGH